MAIQWNAAGSRRDTVYTEGSVLSLQDTVGGRWDTVKSYTPWGIVRKVCTIGGCCSSVDLARTGLQAVVVCCWSHVIRLIKLGNI